MDDFNENMKVGTTGEILVLNHLETFLKGQYKDLRKDAFCQMKDIDFAFIFDIDWIITFDVKTDQTFCPDKGHYNIPYQTKTGNKLGAALYSQADYFAFVSKQKPTDILWVNVKRWQDFVNANRHRLDIISFNVLGGGEGILCDSRELIEFRVAKYKTLPHIDDITGNKEVYKYIKEHYLT